MAASNPCRSVRSADDLVRLVRLEGGKFGRGQTHTVCSLLAPLGTGPAGISSKAGLAKDARARLLDCIDRPVCARLVA